jgi:hypothetical protein
MSVKEARAMVHPRLSNDEIARRGQELYEQGIRAKVETEANIGKIIVIEVETGDYEIDDVGLKASKRLRARHPDAALLSLRIGYDAVEAFGGGPLRVEGGTLLQRPNLRPPLSHCLANGGRIG